MSKEYQLAADVVILSTSDLVGNIIKYNSAFREASGYSDIELAGKPHNILRHTDMPKEAFKDFWQTIQAGRPWFGIVKNKRKNGDYYWVAANASPIVENGAITGYLSVRYPATREQIAFASSLYAAVQSGKTPFPYTQVARPNNWGIYIAATLATVPALVGLAGVDLSVGPMAAFSALAVGSIGYLLHQIAKRGKIDPVLVKGAEDIANGRFKAHIANNSEWGFLLNMIRSRVGESAATGYDELMASTIMTTALQSASTNIMIVDPQFKVVQINQSLQAMLIKNEASLQKAIAQFDARAMVGFSFEKFIQASSLPLFSLENITKEISNEVVISGVVLRLNISPIDLSGRCLGYVIELLDRTSEANIVSNVSTVVDGMRNGVLDHKITAPAEGAYLAIKTGINEALDIVALAVHEVTHILQNQANGDFTRECRGDFKGELLSLKEAINTSTARLRDVINLVVSSASIVNNAAKEVAQGAISLSDSVQHQAAALETTSSSMSQINESVKANTLNAQNAQALANKVQATAGEGRKVMDDTILAMSAIEESSSKITDIVNMIDSIAFQTNLLALNAAVEAARAGDHGRGFAVVASEVRNLAQKSADSAKDIKNLIEETALRVSQGASLAQQSGAVLADITNSVSTVTEMITEIAEASSMQSSNIGQVHDSIVKIDEVMQQNAALVEQTSAAAQSMTEQAQELGSSVEFFKVK